MNGKPVKDGEDLVGRVADTPVGTPVNCTVDRDGKHMDFKLTIMDRAEVFKDVPNLRNCGSDADRRAQAAKSRSTSSASSCMPSPTPNALTWAWTPRAVW